ncbi:sugar phosphate nucleotidyltransferase [Gordoniibacillus kamchatkensis]|uniref:sugar phosphate nucleotidyltransferase n=1 Tax=Gordoniibacillus kamchatkensis TaxID=1590651 RepID=UPI0006987C75|nr:NDP-sugar synthase [Paenibacillus sp. VKM B-2647]
MKAVIMAGGKGTRLRPLTCNTPKPMVPLMGRPVMEYTIDLLKEHGISEIVITTQYLTDVIRGYFGDGSDFGVKLHYFEEETPLGTAGSVKQAETFLDETFVVISGDALTDFDLSRAIAYHRLQASSATLVLTRVDHPLEFGVVMTDESGRIIRFLEKPGWGEVFSDTVNTGIYILEPAVLRHVHSSGPFDFSKDLFPLLMSKDVPLYGYIAEGYWSDIGNLEQYRQAQFDLLDGKVKADIRAREAMPRVWIGDGVKLDRTALVEGPAYLGAGTIVEEGVSLGAYSIVGAGGRIEAGASLERAVLWNNVSIGRGAEVTGATLCRNAAVGNQAAVREGAVVGDSGRIGFKSVVQPGVKCGRINRSNRTRC